VSSTTNTWAISTEINLVCLVGKKQTQEERYIVQEHPGRY